MNVKIIILGLIYVLVSTISAKTQPSYGLIGNTDKPYYFAAQEVNISLNNALISNSSTESKELVYVLLSDSDGKVVQKLKTYIINGILNFSFQLPQVIETGRYMLSVYSNFSLSQGDNGIFQKIIRIYQPNDLPLSNESARAHFINCYPESGYYVAGVTNRVAFHLSHFCSEDSITIHDKSSILNSFKPKHSVGSFYVVPEVNSEIFVTQNCNGKKIVSTKLSEAVNNEPSLSVQKNKSITKVIIQHKSTEKQKEASIELLDNSKLFFSTSGILKNGGIIFQIPNSEMPKNSIDLIVRFNESETLIKRKIDFRNYKALNIRRESRNFSARDTVKAKIDHFNKSAYSTVNVLPAEWLEDNYEELLLQRLLIGVEPSDWEKIVDDWSIIQTHSKKVEFENSDSSPRNFESYLYLKGQLEDTKNLPDSSSIFFFVPEVNMIYQTKTDNSGLFSFPLLIDFYDQQKIKYYVYSDGHEFIQPKIDVDSEVIEFQEIPLDTYWTNLQFKEIKELETTKRIEDASKFYSGSNKNLIEPNSSFNINSILSQNDDIYNLDEYVAFETMEEVTREILSGVFLRKKKGRHTLNIFSNELSKTFEEGPFIFIDNRPTKDVNTYLNLDPSKINNIKVIKSGRNLEKLGPFGEGGLIIIESKDGATFNSNILDDLIFTATGLSSYKPQRKVIHPSLPDLRSVLLWSPNNKVVPFEEFTIDINTSDRPGKYVIIVESIFEDGSIGYGSETFNVLNE